MGWREEGERKREPEREPELGRLGPRQVVVGEVRDQLGVFACGSGACGFGPGKPLRR